ncbi:hypothetical protein SAMN05216276_106337 [Streptosporangium subroseum]|uniref:Uncharacterized protein n=1 Tax=Streptosporangium subroseum TaxID=106412 RepID=A0A239NP89_9ACTN|nr:hypothetical protein [Streptosporangium subroseum]SNT56198.1 hypothetical protein SAMN05216276_106337 [Streptosporangium subroseum]
MSAVTRDVLALVSEGLSNRVVTAQPTVTERPVEAHVAQIFATPGSHDSGLRHAGVARLASRRPGGAHAHPAGTAGREPKLDGSGCAV